MRTRASAVLAGVLLAATIGWAGSDSPAGGAPPAGPSSARRHVVEMRGFRFVPARVQAVVGDTIVWVNRDAVPHTATDTASAWDSGSVAPAASWEWLPSEAGTSEYLCAFHPIMRGAISVEAARAPISLEPAASHRPRPNEQRKERSCMECGG